MQIRLRTRSGSTDYRWLAAPTVVWWEAPEWGTSLYRQAGPTLLALRQPAGPVGVLLTGIVSGRRDATASQAPITYDVLLSRDGAGRGTMDFVPELGVEASCALVAEWWRERATPEGRSWALGLAFDELFVALQDPLLEDSVRAQRLPTNWSAGIASRLKSRAVSTSRQDNREFASDPLIDWVGSDVDGVAEFIDALPRLLLAGRSVAYMKALDARDLASGRDASMPTRALLIVDADQEVHWRPKVLPAATDAPVPARPRGCALILLATLLVTVTAALTYRLVA